MSDLLEIAAFPDSSFKSGTVPINTVDGLSSQNQELVQLNEIMSIPALETIFRRLQCESEDRMEMGMKSVIQSSIIDAVNQHVHSLRTEIAHERTERQQQISTLSSQLSSLQSQVVSLQTSTPTGSISSQSKMDTIVLGGFSAKSKDGALYMFSRLIKSESGHPKIIAERVGNVPSVVPVQFDSSSFAFSLIEKHKSTLHWEGFWCNMSQTKEERAYFRDQLASLYKIKAAGLQICSVDASSAIVDKSRKVVSMKDGYNPVQIALMKSKDNILWSSQISEEVKARYAILTQ